MDWKSLGVKSECISIPWNKRQEGLKMREGTRSSVAGKFLKTKTFKYIGFCQCGNN